MSAYLSGPPLRQDALKDGPSRAVLHFYPSSHPSFSVVCSEMKWRNLVSNHRVELGADSVRILAGWNDLEMRSVVQINEPCLFLMISSITE